METKIAILEFAASRAAIRPRELPFPGNPRKAIAQLVARGDLIRLDRGLYCHAHGEFGAKVTLAEASLRITGGVVCLLSALRFHELTTVDPHEVWMAVGHKRTIRVDYPKVRIVRMTSASHDTGIKIHRIDGVDVNVYTVAKTIADCFKFRRVVGLDVAIEALKDGWARRAFRMDDLWNHAKDLRVLRIMRPYMEML